MSVKSVTEYQQLAALTAKPGTREERLFATALGLSGESAELLSAFMGIVAHSGSISESLKKHLIHGHDLDRATIIKEMGDVFWYLALGCETLEISMLEVMAHNIEKLRHRYGDKFSSLASINREDS